VQLNDQAYAAIEDRIMNQRPYGTIIGTAVFVPLISAAIAGVLFAIFTPIMGGQGTFKQAYAVVVHSGVVLALQTLFIYPMFYLKESMDSPTALTVFLPFLAEKSFAGYLAAGIDLFRIWWIVNMAIGFAVVYRRKAAPVAWSLLAVYGLIVIVFAGVRVALSGA